MRKLDCVNGYGSLFLSSDRNKEENETREERRGDFSLSLSLRELFPTIKEPFPWFEARKGGGEKTALFRNEGRSLFRGRLVSSLFREGRIWRGDNDEAATSNRPQRQLERRLVKKKKKIEPVVRRRTKTRGKKEGDSPSLTPFKNITDGSKRRLLVFVDPTTLSAPLLSSNN